MADLNTGLVTQIIGPVLDIVFTGGKLPPIYSAVEIALEDGTVTVCEDSLAKLNLYKFIVGGDNCFSYYRICRNVHINCITLTLH